MKKRGQALIASLLVIILVVLLLTIGFVFVTNSETTTTKSKATVEVKADPTQTVYITQPAKTYYKNTWPTTYRYTKTYYYDEHYYDHNYYYNSYDRNLNYKNLRYNSWKEYNHGEYSVYVKNKDSKSGYFTVTFYVYDERGKEKIITRREYIGEGQTEEFEFKNIYGYSKGWSYRVNGESTIGSYYADYNYRRTGCGYSRFCFD